MPHANPASPLGASTLPTCSIDTDSFDGPMLSVAEPVLSPTVKVACVARHAIVTAERAIHQQVGSLTRQGQFDRIITCAAQQVRPIVEGDRDVSPFTGAVSPLAPTPTNRTS